MEDLVRFLAENLVEHPEAVEVRTFTRGRRVRIRLSVASEDMGRIIGKEGRIADALREIVRVAARVQGKRATLEIR
ncbi:MAG: KH domain-containing protein [Ardenticatenia bacterium]|nr:KH domain-containing protein [Ardenticatenia bacterium]